MNKTQHKQLMEAVDNTHHLCDLDTQYEYLKDFDTEDDLQEYLQERIYEQDVIYYHKAMEFLMEYDNSLTTSMGIANEMGCIMENLTSETLATLLLQQLMSEELSEALTAIDWD